MGESVPAPDGESIDPKEEKEKLMKEEFIKIKK